MKFFPIVSSRRFLLVAVSLVALTGLFGCRCASDAVGGACEPTYPEGSVPVTVHASGSGDHQLMLEVARTNKERGRGLMFRDGLAQDGGMLFVFDQEGDWPFYMRNTYIPLDIIHVDGRGNVCGWLEDMKPHDWTSRSPGCMARYVIEVVAGSVRAWGLRVGDRVDLPELSSD